VLACLNQLLAEITNYEETSTYADVHRVITGLVSSSPLVYTESFGKSEEGRELPLMVISDPRVTTSTAWPRCMKPSRRPKPNAWR